MAAFFAIFAVCFVGYIFRSMESGAFRRLLARLLFLPLLSLAGLAFLLGSTLQQLITSARWVDHSDRVIASANDLNHLIVDEETGLRGYIATGDAIFLEPFRSANRQIESRFGELLAAVSDSPEQTAALQRIRARYRAWLQAQQPALGGMPQSQIEPFLLAQKAGMDDLRGEWAQFILREQQLRDARTAKLTRMDKFTFYSLIILSLFTALLIAAETRRSFRQVAVQYQEKLRSVERAQRETYASELWLRTTLRSIADGVIACGPDGHITFMNPVAEQLTGWQESDAHGRILREVFRIVNEKTREPVENPAEKLRRGGIIAGTSNHTALIRRDGFEIAIEHSGASIQNKEGEMIGIVLIFRDITEKRRTDAAIMQAEKLASAGRLTASIAHEVNNPLEALMNLLYLARRTEDVSESRHLLSQAEPELARISHIARQSLGFYKDSTAMTEFDLSEVVRKVVDFYRPRGQINHVRLTTEISGDTAIIGSRGEVQQVLSNLLANSLDACIKDCVVRVRVRGATSPLDASEGARITVADNGCGISEAAMHRVFEAFYTTKGTTGTGLGLWVTRQLVEKHGGSMRLRSRSSGGSTGTVFSIFLPKQRSAVNLPRPEISLVQ